MQFLTLVLIIIAAFISLSSAAGTRTWRKQPTNIRYSYDVPTAPPFANGTQGGSNNTAKKAGRDSNDYVSPITWDTPPDVLLRVPRLSVDKIELDVDNIQAHVNLNAEVANLVTINAGVAIGIQKVNITIADVEARAELDVRLGHLVDIVNRVFSSLDLNPLLINALDTVTDVVDNAVTGVVGVVDGLLGTVTQGGQQVSFTIDNLGNIVHTQPGQNGQQQSQIVGNYQQNMTFTGETKTLQGGDVQKTYKYPPMNALVDIIFNQQGQVKQASVRKGDRPNTPGNTGGQQQQGGQQRQGGQPQQGCQQQSQQNQQGQQGGQPQGGQQPQQGQNGQAQGGQQQQADNQNQQPVGGQQQQGQGGQQGQSPAQNQGQGQAQQKAGGQGGRPNRRK